MELLVELTQFLCIVVIGTSLGVIGSFLIDPD